MQHQSGKICVHDVAAFFTMAGERVLIRAIESLACTRVSVVSQNDSIVATPFT